MADLIDRQALMDDIQAAADNGGMGAVVAGTLKRYAKRVPAVDAVEVVRCKDCKKNPNFVKTSGKHMVWCRKWRCEVKDTDFCSYGDRREENAAD